MTGPRVTIVAELAVCVDCAMMLANGELGQGDPEQDNAHAELMARHLGDWNMRTVLSGGDYDEDWFSFSPCQGCGSHLGGDRMAAVVLSA